MKKKDTIWGFVLCAILLVFLCGCSADSDGSSSVTGTAQGQPAKTGLIADQILDGADGEIHYGYYLPDGYGETQKYPMMVVMPGYDRMWFGETSSGSNLSWRGFLCWTELEEDMIVVSAQLTDWGEKSARQAVGSVRGLSPRRLPVGRHV